MWDVYTEKEKEHASIITSLTEDRDQSERALAEREFQVGSLRGQLREKNNDKALAIDIFPPLGDMKLNLDKTYMVLSIRLTLL